MAGDREYLSAPVAQTAEESAIKRLRDVGTMTIEGPRAASKGEFRSALQLSDRVFRAHGISSGDEDYPILFNEGNLEGLRVFADDGKVVSLVGMVERDISLLGTRHLGCCIGAVCTDPDYRGQGLATRLLIDAREKGLKDGVDIFLISGSRSLYRRQGYVPEVGSYRVCTIKRDQLPSAFFGARRKRGGYVLRPWRSGDLPALARIHSAEPVRFVRTPEDFLAVLGCGRVVSVSGETKVVCMKGADEPVAYISYQIGGHRWEDKDENAVAVAEMGGPRWAIVQALGGLFDERGVDSMTLRCLDCDAEIGEMARSLRWRSEAQAFGGTVGIIDPARFWEACGPLFRERLAQDEFDRLSLSADGSARITYGDEELVLDGMSAFTRLVFLARRRRGELELGLAPDSELAQVLDKLFPLPLVDYGLNYI